MAVRRIRIGDIVIAGVLGVLVIITAYPFYYTVMASISEPELLSASQGLLLWPQGINLRAYTLVFQNPMILVGYKNTLIYVVLGTIINMVFTLMGAYALSRKGVFWSKPIILIIIFAMYFSDMMIPTYLLISDLGWINTIWAIVIPKAVSSWNLIILRTNLKNVPDSIEEAARIDGANDFTILARIFVPLSLPIIAVITLFYAVWNWNSWFPAAIYFTDRTKQPLQNVLRDVLILNNTDAMTRFITSGENARIAETLKYATIMVSTLPIMLVYPFLQKYFIKGIMIGGIKE